MAPRSSSTRLPPARKDTDLLGVFQTPPESTPAVKALSAISVALGGVGLGGQCPELALAAVVRPLGHRTGQPGFIRSQGPGGHHLGEPFTLVGAGVLALRENPVDVAGDRRGEGEQHDGRDAQAYYAPDQVADVNSKLEWTRL